MTASEKLMEEFRQGRISRRAFLRGAAQLGISASLLGSVLAGLPEPGLAKSTGRGGTLVVAMEGEADVLDPHVGVGALTDRVLFAVFEPLISRDLVNPTGQTGKIIPGLVQKVDRSSDGLAYTFHLKPGVKFQDATPFDADAVKFNIERQWDQTMVGKKNAPWFYPKAGAMRSWVWQPSGLTSIDVVDAHTVRFNLSHPFVEFLNVMTNGGPGSTCMMSPASVKKWGNENVANHPVGTGPFRFVDRVWGSHITLERNTTYWDPARSAKLDKLIFRPIASAASRVLALQSNEVNLVFAPEPNAVGQLKGSGYPVSMRENPAIWFISLSPYIKQLEDVRVRRAIAMGIDRHTMAKELLKGTVLAAESMQGRTCAAYDPKFRWYPYDPAKGRKLLKEAGYGKGFDLVFEIPTTGSGEIIPVPMAEWIARDLAKIGINVKLRTYEWIAYITHWGRGLKEDPGVGINQMSWGGQSSLWWLNLDFLSTSGFNTRKNRIPGVDQLLAEGERTFDDAKRWAICRKIDAINKELVWDIPIVNDLAPNPMAPNVHGFVHTPGWIQDFRTVWVG